MPTPIVDGLIHLTGSQGTTLTLPSTVTIFGLPQKWRNSASLLAGRAGEVHQEGPTPDAFDFTIGGMLNATSVSDLQSRLDALKAILAEAPVKVRMNGAADTRYLVAYPTTLSRFFQMNPLYGDLSVGMRASEPFFQGDPVTVNRTGISASPYAWQVSNSGNVPTNPVFTITCGSTANFSNLYLANTDTSERVVISGAFTNGDVIMIDTDRFTATVNGVSVMDNAADEWLLGSFALGAGTVNLQLSTDSGTFALDSVVTTFTPRWY